MFQEPIFTFRTIIRYALFACCGIGLTLYVVYQARFLILGPQVTITSDTWPVQTERVITVMGTTANINTITLNDRAIVTDETGNFEEAILLENGYTILTIRATDRYGRETVIEQPYVYVAPEDEQSNT